MNYTDFLLERNVNFNTANQSECIGTVVVTFEGTPLVKEIGGHYFVWVTESVAVTKRQSFAWEISESAAKAFRSYKAANANIAFRSFIDGRETIIDLWDKSVVFSG